MFRRKMALERALDDKNKKKKDADKMMELKIAVIGEGGVGKSALTVSFTTGSVSVSPAVVDMWKAEDDAYVKMMLSGEKPMTERRRLMPDNISVFSKRQGRSFFMSSMTDTAANLSKALYQIMHERVLSDADPLSLRFGTENGHRDEDAKLMVGYTRCIVHPNIAKDDVNLTVDLTFMPNDASTSAGAEQAPQVSNSAYYCVMACPGGLVVWLKPRPGACVDEWDSIELTCLKDTTLFDEAKSSSWQKVQMKRHEPKFMYGWTDGHDFVSFDPLDGAVLANGHTFPYPARCRSTEVRCFKSRVTKKSK